jgi:predicted anti-sigma-YlaC factor YlaD
MEVSGGQLCTRARFLASLRIDGELSELEGVLLDGHLAACDGCREAADGFAAAARMLRAEPPVTVAPVVIQLKRTPRRAFATVAVAAVVLLGVIAGGVVRGEVSRETASIPHAVAIVAGAETADQLRRLRRPTLLNTRKLPRDISAEPV